MKRETVRVLIVEDSRLYQAYLKRTIESDPLLRVIGIAGTGQEALILNERLKPDVITLDLNLPDVRDFELLKKLLAQRQVPIVVVTSQPSACEDAILHGAGDFIEKIQNGGHTPEEFQFLLTLKLKMQVSRHRRSAQEPLRRTIQHVGIPKQTPVSVQDGKGLIVLGASLGGTEATLEVLQGLPAQGMPGILVVQHMPAGFTNAYAMRLDRCCGLTVREVRNGELVTPGTVLVAKGGEQMTVQRANGGGYRVRSTPQPETTGFCPSVDVLFRSAAQVAGSDAVGVILTGMGRDGAEGLEQMHNKGAYTIGQNKETCAVFGMPAAAWALGAVDKLLPIGEIAQEMARVACGTAKLGG